MEQTYRDFCSDNGIDGDTIGIDGRVKGTTGSGTSMMGGGGGYNSEDTCWDCNLPGHRRGDAVCRKPGAVEGDKAPGWLKQLKADGKDTQPMGKQRKTSRQGQPNKTKAPCRYAARGQECPRTDCRFNHDIRLKGGGGAGTGGGDGSHCVGLRLRLGVRISPLQVSPGS